MLREIRSWQEEKTIFSHVKYVGRDFYGPMLDLIIIHEEDLMPVVEVIATSSCRKRYRNWQRMLM